MILPLGMKLLSPDLSETASTRAKAEKRVIEILELKRGQVIRVQPFGYAKQWITARVETMTHLHSCKF